jgi:hypothetical protein
MTPGAEHNEFRKNRLKIIPNLFEGPFLIRHSLGNTPAILSRKITTAYFWGDRYLELDIDVASSTVANTLFGMIKGSLKSLTLDLAWVIEGQNLSELPEHILGTLRINHINVDEHAIRLS